MEENVMRGRHGNGGTTIRSNRRRISRRWPLFDGFFWIFRFCEAAFPSLPFVWDTNEAAQGLIIKMPPFVACRELVHVDIKNKTLILTE